MKRILFTAAVLMLAVAPILADDKPFVSKEGKFSVKFKGQPKSEVKEENGSKQYYFTEQNAALGLFFMALYADFPDKEVAGKTPKELIKDFVTGLAGGFQGVVSSEKDVSLAVGKFPGGLGANKITGREVVIKSAQGVAMVGRVFVMGKRIYLVAAAGAENAATGPDAKSFIGSFELK